MTTLQERAARFVLRVLLLLRPAFMPLFRIVPAGLRTRVRTGLLRRGWATSRSVTDADLILPELHSGITLIGYPRAEFGMGEALRSMARAANSAGIPVETYNFTLHLSARQGDATFDALSASRPQRRTNVFCINADLLLETIQILGPSALLGRYNIARPFWELPTLPSIWRHSLNVMDEIWVATRFNQEAFSAAVDRPVRHIPVAIPAPSPGTLPRSHFGMPDRAFVFAFSFDFASYASRKNPQAVVDAFRLAFPDPADTGVALVVKMMGNGPGRETALSRLRASARKDARILLVDRVFSRTEVDSFLSQCDCYVSLHRSEGFGLGLAEAMARGKPVIATNYSGTTDFISAATGYPVPFQLIEVRPRDYPHFQSGQYWADPDIEAAAAYMQKIFRRQDEALAIGMAAREHIATHHNAGAVGKIIVDRLTELGLISSDE